MAKLKLNTLPTDWVGSQKPLPFLLMLQAKKVVRIKGEVLKNLKLIHTKLKSDQLVAFFMCCIFDVKLLTCGFIIR